MRMIQACVGLLSLVACAPFDQAGAAEPRGALVVQAREGKGPFRLLRLPLERGGAVAPLTEGPDWSYHPMRQPFDERVVYLRRAADGATERREMLADGRDDRAHRPDAGAERDLVMSPDGRWLAYAEERDGNEDLFVRPIAGDVAERRLTTHAAADRSPRWSPDGVHLWFRSDRDGEGVELFRLDVVSGEITQWTRDDAFVNDHAVAPDGASVLLRSNRDQGNTDLYVLDIASGALRRLTSHPAFDGEGCWSPDGAWIAFQSEREGNAEIYLIRPDGSDLRRLTATPERSEGVPAWMRH